MHFRLGKKLFPIIAIGGIAMKYLPIYIVNQHLHEILACEFLTFGAL